MPENQHKPGTITRLRREPQLKGVNEAPCLEADLGEKNRDTLMTLVDEKAFWKAYGFSIRVDGQRVALNADCRPEPEPITRKLLERPDSKYRRLQEFFTWLTNVAEPSEALEAMNRLLRNN